MGEGEKKIADKEGESACAHDRILIRRKRAELSSFCSIFSLPTLATLVVRSEVRAGEDARRRTLWKGNELVADVCCLVSV